MKKFIKSVAMAALLCGAALPVSAQQLKMGLASEQSSIDPQFSRTGNNQNTSQMIFEQLVSFDQNLQISPGLATEWTNLDPLTWEIKLRPGVTFQNGTPFTADDVIFSLDRADKVPNSPAPYTDMVSSLDKVEKLDDLTLKITTKTPNPQLIEDLGRVFIISKAASEGKATEDFNSGAAAIGTGPYKFVSWVPGQDLKLQAYDGYWGEKPEFQDVDIKFISNDAARVAALLSGAVDLIDTLPVTDAKQVAANDKFTVLSEPSGRIVYLALSMRDDTAPGVTDAQGKPLAANPFRDARVRKAISLMIDRQLIVDRLLGGAGVPSGQLVPEVLGGYASDLTPQTPDAAEAKKLLAEAGYPEGFGLTVVSSNDRFPGDADLAQALGQMLTRGGLKVNGVQVYPYNVYAKDATGGSYGAFVFSLGASTPTSAPMLGSLLRSYDKEAGTGAFNRMRFSSPEFDAALAKALAEFDPAKRNELLAEATRIAFAQTPIVPLYWQKIEWGMKKGLSLDAGLSEYTLPQNVRTVK
ncbi:ABC transporter substrate-binding protein [Paracoccus aminophilus]|uniref:Peptide/nickel transport system, substrate-binding protein n=1 Tax=Paracoccus aminophilus JCM 7686 TaxID=1367847 RepID=S5XUG0_PARAH|nr:ABC transporter substrate-binding protein [Paracoccus aminophilus]AGT08847.1 peptide/nickel transport system, substrate-binding protein [Paracoccus aminophilus JCM 7686]